MLGCYGREKGEVATLGWCVRPKGMLIHSKVYMNSRPLKKNGLQPIKSDKRTTWKSDRAQRESLRKVDQEFPSWRSGNESD